MHYSELHSHERRENLVKNVCLWLKNQNCNLGNSLLEQMAYDLDLWDSFKNDIVFASYGKPAKVFESNNMIYQTSLDFDIKNLKI